MTTPAQTRPVDLRPLGTSPLRVPAICLGTMTFGEQNSEPEAHAQLDYAFERGLTFIDAAEMYPVPAREETTGRTEAYIGTWLKTKRRDQVTIATKIAGPGRGWTWVRGGPKSVDADNIRQAIEGSLRKLQTDYVDLYQIHWPARSVPTFGGYQFTPAADDQVTPIREQLETLGALVREGKVRAIGLSNEHPWGLMQFLRLADELGLPRVASVQNAYNLLNRTLDFSMAEVLHREGVGLLAYSPLAFGHLTAKYVEDPSAQGRAKLFAAFGQRYTKPNVEPAVKAYAALAREAGLTPAQLALSWVFHRWSVTSTIVGATSVDQLKTNLDAWDVRLSEDVLKQVEAIHLRYTNPAP